MSPLHKILIIDDAAINLHLLDGVLKPEYSVLMAKNGQQGLKLAREQTPDLILLDVVMPEMDGYRVLHRLQADRRTKDIPVIFITGKDTPEDEARGLQYGAVDYITKPLHEVIVKARVATHLKLARQRHMLEILANIDGLTELPNRRQLDKTLEREIERSKRSGLPLSLAIIDVDCFKQFNDHFGHAHGDKALQSVARLLANNLCRPGDMVARYGGEEFVLLLPDTTEQGAWLLVDTIRKRLEESHLPHPASCTGPWLTISAGIATSAGTPDCDAEKLLQLADQRLYQAKRNGRNAVISGSKAMQLADPLSSLGQSA